MYALISPNHIVYDQANNILGSVVTEFSSTMFEVTSTLMWVDVDDSHVDLDSQFYYFSSETNQVIKMSESMIQEKLEVDSKKATEQMKQRNDLDQQIAILVAKKLAELTSNNSSSNT